MQLPWMPARLSEPMARHQHRAALTKDLISPRSVLQLLFLIMLALVVLVPLLWLVSTSLKGPAEDIFTSPPALLPAEPSLDAYGRLFRDNPLGRYLLNSTLVSLVAVVDSAALVVLRGGSAEEHWRAKRLGRLLWSSEGGPEQLSRPVRSRT